MRKTTKAVFTTLGLGLLGVACTSTDPNDPMTGATAGTTTTAETTAGMTTADATTGMTTDNPSGAGGGGQDTGGGVGAAPGAGGGGMGAAPGAGGSGTVIGASGGAGNGGGSGGGAVVPEPELVVSGPGAYWQEQQLTMGGTNAAVTVNSGDEKQEWHGFGGTFNEKGWQALMTLSEGERNAVMSLLFSDTNGLGLTWGRIPLGPSDYALDRYAFSSSPDGAFDISRDKMHLMPYVKAAQAVKGDIKFWASPWSPPPWAKTGGGNGGYDRGSFNTAYYQEYADYFVSWIKAYEAEGIPMDHVQPQNEPGWAQGYPSCAFGPGSETEGMVTLGTFTENYLLPSIEAAGLTTGVWYGTLSNVDTGDAYWAGLSQTGRGKIGGVGLQWGTMGLVGQLRNAGFLVMQTEHKCGNYPWLGTAAASAEAADENSFFSQYAPNNHNYGVESWDLFKQWIEAGVNIYSAWNMVLDKGGFNLDLERPWPQNALIWVDTEANPPVAHATAYYYAYRHLAQFVDPGAKVLGVTGAGNALAFKNPDNSVVAVVYNGGGTGDVTVSIDGTMFTVNIPGRGWATINYGG